MLMMAHDVDYDYDYYDDDNDNDDDGNDNDNDNDDDGNDDSPWKFDSEMITTDTTCTRMIDIDFFTATALLRMARSRNELRTDLIDPPSDGRAIVENFFHLLQSVEEFFTLGVFAYRHGYDVLSFIQLQVNLT